MRYMNRRGDPITRLAWEKLYRDPAYSVLGRQRRKLADGQWQSLADVSWIGAAFDTEVPPLALYVVRHFGYKDGKQQVKYDWYESEARAMVAYQKLAVELEAATK